MLPACVSSRRRFIKEGSWALVRRCLPLLLAAQQRRKPLDEVYVLHRGREGPAPDRWSWRLDPAALLPWLVSAVALRCRALIAWHSANTARLNNGEALRKSLADCLRKPSPPPTNSTAEMQRE